MQSLLASPFRNLVFGVAFMLVVMALATLAYVECGWSVGDALYMVIITVYTVGFEEIHPIDTPLLRTITITLIVTGCTGMIFLTGVLVQAITVSQFQQIFGFRRMQKDIDGLSGHVIICGYGRIGQMLARELRAGRCDFVILDRGDEKLNAARQLGYLCLVGDATDEDVLKRAGVMRARALATALPDDAANVFITLSARSLNRELSIIARGELPSTEGKLLQAGANRVVLPTRIGAERMAELVLYQNVDRLLGGAQAGDFETLGRNLRRLGLEIEVVAAEQGSRCIGATVADIEALGSGAFLIVALDRQHGETILQPQGNVVIQAGDGVAVVGRPGRAQAMEALFAQQAKAV